MKFRLTLPLSIQSAAAVVGATKLVTAVTRQIGKAVNFADVLASAGASESATESASEPERKPVSAIDDATSTLAKSVQQKLSALGIDPNQLPGLHVNDQGELQLGGDHPKAAEIEAALADDPAVRDAVDSLVAVGGRLPISVDLTNGSPQANIPHQFGGYANWLAD